MSSCVEADSDASNVAGSLSEDLGTAVEAVVRGVFTEGTKPSEAEKLLLQPPLGTGASDAESGSVGAGEGPCG